MGNNLESHVQYATAYNSVMLLLCIVGIILNVGLLVIIYIRKQVRRSIYTTYMIQIAVTDAVVCVIWLILVALQLAYLPSVEELHQNFKEDISIEDELPKVKEVEEETRGIFLEQRMFYAMYNFHFYNNIFLLAVMSVERCVAVMKSLRCQRYQFNKKFIYAASGAMWLLAFVLALPTFINPDLIVGHQTDFEGNKPFFNASSNNAFSESSMSATYVIYECHKPLLKAEQENSSFVEDCCDVSVRVCINLFMEYANLYNDILKPTLKESNETDLDSYEFDSYYGDDDGYPYDSGAEVPYTDDYALTHKVDHYKLLYLVTLDKISAEVSAGDVDTCDPLLDKSGQIYQIIANLTIGFFVPFIAIVISNLLIACVIRGRARSRLESDNVEEEQESLVGRRMSDFLRQFSHASRSEGESYRKASPVTKHDSKNNKTERLHSRSVNENTNGVEAKKSNKPATSTAITFHPASPATSPEHKPIVKTREPRVRLSSFSNHFRRTSGGSGSSAESFLTEMTSLQTNSSPGVRLSAPLFVQTQDGRTLIQRACSAENSGSSGSSSRPSSVRRWSSEVFRNSPNVDEGRKLVPSEEIKAKENQKETVNSDEKFISTVPPRGRTSSTQGLLESQGRIYTAKQQKYNRAPSYQQNNRVRAYSAASRTSAGGAGNSNSLPKQTIVYKHALKQMKVSRTVLIYVIVFAICWIPQRVVHFVYVTEGLVNKGGQFCNILTSTVRVISFFSVLLNPVVYAVTQKELRHFLRRSFNRIYRIRKNIPKSKKRANPRDETNERNPSASVMNHLSTDELSKMERHVRNRERWFRLVHRLGPRSAWHSITASGVSTYNKPSDGTIDEEREDEKDKSSKGQSSSNSFKGQISKGQSSSTSFKLNNVASGWEDWQQLIDMAEPQNTLPRTNGHAEVML